MQSTRISTKLTKRAFFGLFVVAVLFLGLILKILGLQTVDFEYYRNKVLDQLTTESTILSERGNIYDSNGVLLATNKTAYRIFIAPKTIREEMNKAKEDGVAERYDLDQKISRGLSELLGVDYETVYAMTGKTASLDATVLREATPDQADAVLDLIAELKVSNCIYVEPMNVRYYCYGDLATHLLGFTGRDGDGLYGIEYYYNKQLAGIPGKFITARDAYGNEMPYKYQSYIDAVDGYNLNTTIDIKIQAILEEQLEATYRESGAQAGVAGMVMNVKTGAIYAMGTYPDFDSNDAWTLSDEYALKLEESGLTTEDEGYSALRASLLNQMWQNKALTFTYMPGSTFKIITTAMAIETGANLKLPTCNCRGSLNLYGSVIKCHKKGGHGVLTFAGGLQQSCNPYMMELADIIGRPTFYSYVKNFGYLEKTGIDLPGEGNSSFWDEKSFGPVDLAVASFGQNFKISMVQHLRAISAVANGGMLVEPYVVQSMSDSEGNVIWEHELKQIRQVVSESACKQVATILKDGVAGDGGSKNAYVAGYRVAAKTGTSEKIGDDETLRIGSCVAFAPAEDPEIAIIIIVDEPTCSNVYGSYVAAPYIANCLEQMLPALGIEAEYTSAESAKLEVEVDNYAGMMSFSARQAIEKKGLDVEIIGNGEKVTAQVPAAGSKLSKQNGKVILYVGDAAPKNELTVPNVIGMSASAANRVLINAGFNISIEGATNYDAGSGAVVVAQFPAAGSEATRGDVVSVTFRHTDVSD
jgi:stage V sporulation protein D (sporulation-specific penicillin-binding protein)